MLNKADMLDELRSQIGVMADRNGNQMERIYPLICDLLVHHVSAYQSALIYLVESAYFKKGYSAGKENLPNEYRFGEGQLSIAAVRGSMVYERTNDQGEVYLPFYFGHHLIGVLVILGKKYAIIDDEDLTLFCEIISLFESKIKKGKT